MPPPPLAKIDTKTLDQWWAQCVEMGARYLIIVNVGGQASKTHATSEEQVKEMARGWEDRDDIEVWAVYDVKGPIAQRASERFMAVIC